MAAPVEIRPVPAAQTRPLRKSILRPTQPPEMMVYPGDEEPSTLHVGAFRGEGLVGVGSIYRESPPGKDDWTLFRVRGMAVLESERGQGTGAAVLAALLAHAARQGGTKVWCNGRMTARGFYEAKGFVAEGEPFELPDMGAHIRMWRPLP